MKEMIIDSLSTCKEVQLRTSSCSFIKAFAMENKMTEMSALCAAYHRLHLYSTFQHFHHDHLVVAAACLLLAFKGRECISQMADDICAFLKKVAVREQSAHDIHRDVLNAQQEIDETVGTIGLEKYPHQFLRPYIQAVMKADPLLIEQYSTMQQIGQVSWNFVADSYRTTMCLQFKPSVIAAAALFLACQIFSIDFRFDIFNAVAKRVDEATEALAIEAISDACEQLLLLYESHFASTV
eukprot:GGOE01044925.1.p1 GENE.GGOE01044925.1~~GGOE01044925.1.p1  ORF type:complete len:239 (-),score=23.63 GGOE01044925.1:134-850(-)